MYIKIDQSGKIEDTRVNTALAFSDGRRKTILIDRREKRKLQEIFRKNNKHHVFIFKTFAILIFLLIKNDLTEIQRIGIDLEYPGKDYLIKDYLLTMIRKYRSFDKRDIIFIKVDRKTKAHELAINVHRGHIKPDIMVTKEDIKPFI
ncbi:hypothetical protein AMJ47_02380 [Parcubacteria bacterium DG_72]|nr:MAG: hypothetical protein AMJ47_02380 [Parcubacteria bacterium DG_72]